jgi:primosomal protein N' (replication factor Y)
VWIQTFDPKNAVLQMVQNHDYEALYRHQLKERELFRYPPFHRVIRLQMRHAKQAQVHEAATMLQSHLARIFGKRVSGVIIPSIERVQAYYIRELTLRIEQGANMAEAKRRIKEAIDYISSIPSGKNVKIIADVDPQ